MRKLKILLTIIIFLILLNIILLFTISSNNKNNKIQIINTKTGFETKTFEIGEKIKEQPFIDREYPQRYTEKIWEYYDRLEEARDRSFFR